MAARHALEPDALRGNIDLLILKALALEPMHRVGHRAADSANL